MSFFTRILNRAAAPGSGTTVPAVPKGMAMPLRRALDEESEAHLLRTAKSEGEEELQTLLRMKEEEEAHLLHRTEEEEEAQTLHRVEDDEETAQSLRRVEDEEPEAGALRRTEEEDQAEPLRRTSEEEEEVAQPLYPAGDEVEVEEEAQALRRQDEEQPEEKELQAMRRAGALEEEIPEEPRTAHALRREFPAPQWVGVEPGAAVHTPVVDAPFAPEPESPRVPPPPPGIEPPRVTIDQIDVVIHDDAPAPGTNADRGSADLGRRMRTNYLRWL